MFTLKTAKKKAKRILITLAAATILVSGNTSFLWMTETTVNAADLSQIPNYTGNPYTICFFEEILQGFHSVYSH